MNRRFFLKAIGALGVATSGLSQRAVASARQLPELECTPFGLRLAIERLFPAGVQQSAKAYEDFPLGFSKPLDPSVSYDGTTQRVVHVTYGLMYIVTGDSERDSRMHRALYESMFNTAWMLSERPENGGAVLVWRRHPEEATYRESDFESDTPGPMLTRLTMRLGLRQTGWRERLLVRPWLRGAKPEGATAPLIRA